MFDGYIRDHARWTPRARAMLVPGRQWTYAEFDADIDRLGAALPDLGIVSGCGVVAVEISQDYLQHVAVCALARMGIPSAPGHDHGADIRLSDGAAGGPGPRLVRIDRAWADQVFAAPHRPLPVVDLDPDAIGRVMLSSGTTATPRRVGLTWRRLEAGNLITLRLYGVGRQGPWIPMIGIDALMGFNFALGGWSLGSPVSCALSCEELPPWFEHFESGIIGITPIQLRAVLRALPGGFQARSDWRLFVGGSILPHAIASEARQRISSDLWICYGSTEASINALARGIDLDDDIPGLVGYTPAGGVVEVIGPDGRQLPDGESGDIRIRSSRMTLGYIGDPAGTAERFHDGWFHIGDVGRRLQDGRLVIEGRADDRMNFGGMKFMPQQLEGPALACPGVLDAAVFSVAGADGIDECWLAVVAVPGFDRDSLGAHLAAYPGLPPKRFAWTDAIPRNTMGKIERTKLRDALLAARGAEA